MVKGWRSFFSFAALFCALNLYSKDLSAYKTGDLAEEDIVATVPLNVIDPVATAARRKAEAKRTPTIFLVLPDASITNTIARSFITAFSATRSNFLASFAEKFPAADQTNDGDFSNLLSNFNRGNKTFPVSLKLARQWVTGDAGTETQKRYLGDLLQTMHHPVRADALPKGFVLSETFRLVPVKGQNDKPTLADADRGKTVNEVMSLSGLQGLFIRQFTSRDGIALARALGHFLRPNCVLDVELTQQMRDRDTSQLVAIVHYDKDSVIVHRGEKINATTEAAIAALDEKLLPLRQAQQMAAEMKTQQEQLRQQQQVSQQALAQAEQARQEAIKSRRAELNTHSRELAERTKNYWLIVACAGVFCVAMIFVVLFLSGRRKRKSATGALAVSPVQVQTLQLIQNDFAPQVANVVKEAVVQELAAQRSELLKAQQSAALELAELIHRLDHLHAPLHERLKAYENRIADLEKQLSSRTEENRELLKAKIDLMRQQIETERAGATSGWSPAIN